MNCSCLLLDLDNFKTVNDRYGHDRGDECLEAVVRLVSQIVKRRGKLYRFREGDEFAVILRNAISEEAMATAERIRKEIEQASPGGDVNVTASIGVVCSNAADLSTVDQLVETLDEAMYVSKYKGRNCSTAWPMPEEQLEQVRAARNKAKGRE